MEDGTKADLIDPVDIANKTAELMMLQNNAIDTLFKKYQPLETRTGISTMLVAALISVLSKEQRDNFNVVLSNISEAIGDSEPLIQELQQVLLMSDFGTSLVRDKETS